MYDTNISSLRILWPFCNAACQLWRSFHKLHGPSLNFKLHDKHFPFSVLERTSFRTASHNCSGTTFPGSILQRSQQYFLCWSNSHQEQNKKILFALLEVSASYKKTKEKPWDYCNVFTLSVWTRWNTHTHTHTTLYLNISWIFRLQMLPCLVWRSNLYLLERILQSVLRQAQKTLFCIALGTVSATGYPFKKCGELVASFPFMWELKKDMLCFESHQRLWRIWNVFAICFLQPSILKS